MNNSRSPSEIICLGDFNIDAFALRSTQFVKLRPLFTTFQMQQTLTTPTELHIIVQHVWITYGLTDLTFITNLESSLVISVIIHWFLLPGSLPNSLINTGTSRQDPSEILMIKLSIETSKMLPGI